MYTRAFVCVCVCVCVRSDAPNTSKAILESFFDDLRLGLQRDALPSVKLNLSQALPPPLGSCVALLTISALGASLLIQCQNMDCETSGYRVCSRLVGGSFDSS
mmetsp:Transcript_36627/g.58265  ORF Transcript_36627/g.58265 Transcript_36627/m.58265 type:complete len:103 (-) Transcript_36627:361-669(-)